MKGTKILELRLAVPAAPARVAQATKMIHEVIAAGFPAQHDKLTVVVENRRQRNHITAWDAAAVEAMKSLAAFIKNPTQAVVGLDAAAIAEPMARYLKEELRFGPEFWQPRKREALRVADREFIDHLFLVAKTRPQVREPLLSGTTVVVSAVLRVGRTQDSSDERARIELPGLGYQDVAVDPAAYAAVCDALREKKSGRLRLRVQWKRGASGDLEIEVPRSTILSFEPRGGVTGGAAMVEILSANPALTDAEYDDVMRTLREGRGE